MNCFVIMPFSSEFDDVYGTIKMNVDAVVADRAGVCIRLDDSRPAGRITNRLLQEIAAASLCIADVTGSKPNVMWELGYAMALGKPTILVTQSLAELPFDIRDLQSLEYDRNHIARTLGYPLQRIVLDTLACMRETVPTDEAPRQHEELVGTLLTEVGNLKSMLSDVVAVWAPTRDAAPTALVPEIGAFEGVWLNSESRSHFYPRIVREELVVPYCYNGEHELTAVYFGWRKAGDYWFARFKWFNSPISGFAFLKFNSVDDITGAWWHDEVGAVDAPTTPPAQSGVSVHWKRIREKSPPIWVESFFNEVRNEGLASRLLHR